MKKVFLSTMLIAISIMIVLSCKKKDDPITTPPAAKTIAKLDSNGCVTKAAIKGTWYYYAGMNNNSGIPYHIVLANSQQWIFGDSVLVKEGYSTNSSVTYASDFSTLTTITPGGTPPQKYTVTVVACDKIAISNITSGSVLTVDSLRTTR